MENLKHFLGLCGESHPNIFTIILIAIIGISIIKLYEQTQKKIQRN